MNYDFCITYWPDYRQIWYKQIIREDINFEAKLNDIISLQAAHKDVISIEVFNENGKSIILLEGLPEHIK